jgi:carbonic anhydrase/acetyltransferase-like protein (isoleucine patch superfamily)
VSSETERTSSGEIVGPGSVIAGSVVRFRSFVTSGALIGSGAIVVGTVDRIGGPVTHDTNGELIGLESIIDANAIIVPQIQPESTNQVIGNGNFWIKGKKRFPRPRYWWEKDFTEIPEEIPLPELEQLKVEEESLSQYIEELEYDGVADKILTVLQTYAAILKEQADIKIENNRIQDENRRLLKKKDRRRKAISLLIG